MEIADAQVLLALVSDIDKAKRAVRKFPRYAIRLEARKALAWDSARIDLAATQLQESAQIRIGKTRNDKYYQLINNTENYDQEENTFGA